MINLHSPHFDTARTSLKWIFHSIDTITSWVMEQQRSSPIVQCISISLRDTRDSRQVAGTYACSSFAHLLSSNAAYWVLTSLSFSTLMCSFDCIVWTLSSGNEALLTVSIYAASSRAEPGQNV